VTRSPARAPVRHPDFSSFQMWQGSPFALQRHRDTFAA
jgi:hypothetical protein